MLFLKRTGFFFFLRTTFKILYCTDTRTGIVASYTQTHACFIRVVVIDDVNQNVKVHTVPSCPRAFTRVDTRTRVASLGRASPTPLGRRRFPSDRSLLRFTIRTSHANRFTTTGRRRQTARSRDEQSYNNFIVVVVIPSSLIRTRRGCDIIYRYQDYRDYMP